MTQHFTDLTSRGRKARIVDLFFMIRGVSPALGAGKFLIQSKEEK